MGLATVGAVAWRFRRAESRAASLANLPAPAGETPVEIHGHRGARGLLPENTLPAFEHALALGVDAVELDVGMTRDGVPVVHHDRRLDPDHTRDRSGAWLAPPGPLLRALDLEALAAFDVGRAAPGGETAKRFPRQTPCDGARVPLLREVLALAQRSGGRRFYFNIEVKLTPEAPDETAGPAELARAVVTALCAAGAIDRARVQSFDWRVLAEVRRFAPEVRIGCLTAERLWLDNLQRGRPGPSPWTAGLDVDAVEGSIPRLVKTFGCTAWSPFFRDLTVEGLAEAHRLGLKVVVWTVNDVHDMAALARMGVDGIITDYPDRAIEALKPPVASLAGGRGEDAGPLAWPGSWPYRA